jgi:hypothetical protein
MIETTFEEPHDLLDFKARGLITTHEWWVLRELEIYAFCWMAGGFENPLNPKFTKQISRCSLCGKWARPGILKFAVHWDNMHGSSEARFHPECYERIKLHKVLQWIKK